MTSTDINDPFIQDRMGNKCACFLNSLGALNPELYGEAFITNKYGVMTSTTGKLTTLAHFDKYWWQGAYNDGEGYIYLDDRGYDKSVEGYVLGIVVPVIDNGSIIGMIKVNYKIQNIISNTMTEMTNVTGFGEFQLVRSKGLIVSKEGVEPLSTLVDDSFLSDLNLGELVMGEKNIDDQDVYYAVMPINSTFDNDITIFGGNYDSIDQTLGNQGEFWSVIYTLPDDDANSGIHEVLRILIYGGIMIILLVFCISLFVSYRLSKPMKNLLKGIKLLSSGDLLSRVECTSNDEIGELTVNFNEMIDNLNRTLTSKDILEQEVKENEILHQKLIDLARMDELTQILNRRAFNEFYNSYFERAIRYKYDIKKIYQL